MWNIFKLLYNQNSYPFGDHNQKQFYLQLDYILYTLAHLISLQNLWFGVIISIYAQEKF